MTAKAKLRHRTVKSYFRTPPGAIAPKRRHVNPHSLTAATESGSLSTAAEDNFGRNGM